MNVFNEIDPYAAEWLRNLGADRVLEKSIADVNPEEVHDATRFHTFAGIGLWEYALKLADWPADVPVWTGSCPCQPFSTAGKGKGEEDPRHLWPDWRKLIEVARPPVLFGEQVASPAGRNWLDAVSADLEALGYAIGSADLCAAGVGAPHVRQRLFFVASSGELGNPDRYRSRGHSGAVSRAEKESNCSREKARHLSYESESSGATRGFWADAEWISCSDGKARPVEPCTFPLAHGDPGRVALLRAYGNAIVPQVAATFIQASMDVLFCKK